MRKYIDVTGKTEDEAIRNALAQLNMDRDDVSVLVLERAKAGFLGFGSCPAKVRVSYGPEEEEEVSTPKAETVEKAKKPEPRPRNTPKVEKKPQPPAARETSQSRPERKQEAKPEPRPERKQEAKMKPRPQPQPKTQPMPTTLQEPGADDEKAQEIQRFLTGLLRHMGSSAEAKVYLMDKDRYKVLLEGQNLGALIGRRGETLDAIQQLTSYAVNRSGSRVRIQLDAEGYREKREQSLQHLAHKVAAKVLKYRRSMTLEPMNAYERHVIHAALQEVEGITTYSTGVDPNRRVIVALERTSIS